MKKGSPTSTLVADPDDETVYDIGSMADPLWGFQMGEGALMNVHLPEACAGHHCVVHNPSDHHMRSWALNWRGDRKLMERICPCHGAGHPDPDDLAYQIRIGNAWQANHGCPLNPETQAGCCAAPKT